jgi:hypothetical protein
VQTLRWTGITVCAALAGISFVYGIIYLTEDWPSRAAVSNLGWAALFGVSAVLLWRRVGWRRAGVAFGLLMLVYVVAFIVLVELHTHGYLGGT